MRTAALLLAGCAGAVFAPVAAAQPGDRNAIVYGARAAGETDWHFGGFALQSPDSNPLTFEVGVFFFRAQGYGLSTATYKTYIDIQGTFNYSGNSAQIIDDPSNGITPDDGRQSVYNTGPQNQKVFTNRSTSIPNSGFRISASGDVSDAGAAGGILLKQAGPIGNPGFHTGDGALGFRFDVTLAFTAGGRTVLVHTPFDRIHSYTTFDSGDSNTTTQHKASTVSDSLTLHASWVPAP
jgi:hypothetical protein